jgi:hypothetical protein
MDEERLAAEDMVLLDDPELTRRSPGEEFALAHARMGEQATVELRAAITDLFPPSRRRPRYTVRHLLRKAVTAGDVVTFARETATTTPQCPGAIGVAGVAGTPEARFQAESDTAKVQVIRAAAPVPPEILADPAALAAYVDFRLLVRLGTVENEVLLNGDGGEGILGIARTPGLRYQEPLGTAAETLLAAASSSEWHGGSVDGIVMHPDDWWPLVGRGGRLLRQLADGGVRISRTRRIPAGSAIVGDFWAAATLFEMRRSTIRLAAPGEAPEEGTWLVGEIRETLAVHLPGHFVVATFPS